MHERYPSEDAREARPTPEEVAALRESLSRPLPEVPARYLYDDRGSALFEAITALPEYYPTRAELAILDARAAELMERVRPRELVELGSGAGRKIRALLEAWPEAPGRGCTMIDVNETFLGESIARLAADHPGIRFDGVVGDFARALDPLANRPRARSRMVLFFAGTLGNFHPIERRAFLRRLSRGLGPDDAFLVGVDLVKDPARLEAAYNDAQGVTAAFNKNALSVVNARFGADFDLGRFAHRAFWDAEHARIEMRLRATAPSDVRVAATGSALSFAPGDELRTEVSCKFTRESFASAAADARLTVDAWYTDPDGLFALALLRPGQTS